VAVLSPLLNQPRLLGQQVHQTLSQTLNQSVPTPLLAPDAAHDFDLQSVKSGGMAGAMLPDGEPTIETPLDEVCRRHQKPPVEWLIIARAYSQRASASTPRSAHQLPDRGSSIAADRRHPQRASLHAEIHAFRRNSTSAREMAPYSHGGGGHEQDQT